MRYPAFARLSDSIALLKTGRARLIFYFVIATIAAAILIIVLPYRPTVVALSPLGKVIDDATPVYIMGELPRFTVDTDTIVRESEKKQQIKKFQAQIGSLETTVFDSNGNETAISPLIESTGSNSSQFLISIPDTRMLVPGTLQLKVTLNNGGKSYEIVQNFRWGVLALNFNQSSYDIGEVVQMNIGVINDAGRAVCNAAISVEVEAPDHERSSYSINDGSIALSNDCDKHILSNQPDYVVSHIPKSEGEHKVRITSDSGGGTQAWESTFLVTRNAGFIVRHPSMATRIFPFLTYTAKMEIRTNRPIIGEIHYDIPGRFTIQNISSEGQVSESDSATKTIVWKIRAKSGDVVPLSFEYSSQNKSPEFYLFGPIKVTKRDTNSVVRSIDLLRDDFDFAEPQAWEIMADPSVAIKQIF